MGEILHLTGDSVLGKGHPTHHEHCSKIKRTVSDSRNPPIGSIWWKALDPSCWLECGPSERISAMMILSCILVLWFFLQSCQPSPPVCEHCTKMLRTGSDSRYPPSANIHVKHWIAFDLSSCASGEEHQGLLTGSLLVRFWASYVSQVFACESRTRNF